MQILMTFGQGRTGHAMNPGVIQGFIGAVVASERDQQTVLLNGDTLQDTVEKGVK